jgi:pimeloyl-ACP methyl ester carboxylesterase
MYKAVKFLSSRVSPFSLLRYLPESTGKNLIGRLRGDITSKFEPFFPEDSKEVVSDYIYQTNVSQTPASGEDAFRVLSVPIAYAKLPLEEGLLEQLSDKIDLTFMYGDRTWMDGEPGVRVVDARRQRGVESKFHIIPNASHHIYIDNYEYFNQKMIECLS